MQTPKNPAEARIETLDIYSSYRRAKYLSSKNTAYFQVYEELFSRYRNTKCTFVEVGIWHGGSLFMWRDYFGPEARIIGIDLNPLAKKWEDAGFEIHIGDQADPRFWENFFSIVGDVDVILDDGGHTNDQQIATTHYCIPHIRDEGMLVVEDTGTSYLKLFGNPSRYSFINYVKRMIDRVNCRSRGVYPSDQVCERTVYSVRVYECMVCFNIDRRKSFVGAPISNDGVASDAEDFRLRGIDGDRITNLRRALQKRFSYLRRFALIRVTQRFVFESLGLIQSRFRSRKLKKYFL